MEESVGAVGMGGSGEQEGAGEPVEAEESKRTMVRSLLVKNLTLSNKKHSISFVPEVY